MKFTDCVVSQNRPWLSYLKQYQAGGHRTAIKVDYQGMSSELDKHGKPLESYFKEHPPRTVKPRLNTS